MKLEEMSAEHRELFAAPVAMFTARPATKAIEVRISQSKLKQLDQEAHIGNHVLTKMREAGMPVKGNLFLVIPESGTITVEADDLATDDVVWTWRP